MSVHTRKRVPPHKHFQDEVTEVRNVRQIRPSHRGVHWTDTIMDGSLTLDMTNVDFTRQWEEDKFINVDSNCSIVSDSSAKNGFALKIPAGVGGITEVFDSPYFDGEIAGEIYALFALKVSNNSSSSTIATLRIVASATTRASIDVKPSDFGAANQWKVVAIRGRIEANDTGVYLDVFGFVDLGVDLYVDWIGFVSADVPNGNADVDIMDADSLQSVDTAPSQTVGTSGNATYSKSLSATTWTTVETFSVPNVDHDLFVVHVIIKKGTGESGASTIVRIYDSTDTTYYPSSSGVYGYTYWESQATYFITIPKNVKNHSLQVQVYSSQAVTITIYRSSWGHAPHTHDHTEYSPLRGQTGASDLGHEH